MKDNKYEVIYEDIGMNFRNNCVQIKKDPKKKKGKGKKVKSKFRTFLNDKNQNQIQRRKCRVQKFLGPQGKRFKKKITSQDKVPP